MADNFVTDAGAGGNTYASDDIGGVHYPILKIAYGALDSATLVSTSNGLPVAQQGTWNVGTVTTLTSITNAVAVTDNSGSLTVDNGTLSVVGGGTEATAQRVTIASDSTGVLSVDDNGSTLSVDDGGGSLTVDGTVAVTNAGITTLAGAVYAEDVASAGADPGVLGMAMRQDTPANTSGTDGDYEPLRMSGGRLWVDASGKTLTVGSHAVTNAGTFATQIDGAALTSLQLIDDPVATISATPVMRVAIYDAADAQITSFGGGTQYTEDAAAAANPVGNTPIFVRQDTPASEVSANGDNIAGRATAYGAQYVQLVNSSGGFIDSFSGAGTQYTEDAAAAADPVGTAVNLVRLDTPASIVSADGDNMAWRGSSAGAAYVNLLDGTTKIVSGNGTNAGSLRVTLASDSTGTVAATQSGAWNVGTVTTVSTVSALGNSTTGPQKAEDVASANADVGIPAMAVQKATPANTAGTDGDYEFLQMSAGRLWASATIDAALPAGSNTIGNVNPGTAANWGVYVEDAAETAGGNLMMAGAVRRDTLASSSGTSGDNSTINTNNVGAVWTAGSASTNGGWSVATGSIAATKTDIGSANTAGNVGGWYFYNPNASVAYVQFFNTQASGVTLGTTAPVYSLGIPATSAANVAPGMVGISHSTAISIAVTTTRAGSTGPGSTVDYNIWYKQ